MIMKNLFEKYLAIIIILAVVGAPGVSPGMQAAAPAATPVQLGPGSDCRSTGQVTLPLKLFRGHFVTTATINGRELRMMVDSGASNSAISPAAAADLGLSRNPEHSVHVISVEGKSAAIYPVKVQSIKLGTFEWGAWELSTINIVAPGQEKDPVAPVGLIGADILSAFDVEFDFPKGKMTLYRQLRCTGKMVPWEGRFQTFAATQASGNLLTITVLLNRHPLRALIDSGSDSTIVARAAAISAGADDAKLNRGPQSTSIGPLGTKVAAHPYQFPSMTLGYRQFNNAPVIILDSALFPGIDMLLGSSYFRWHKLWLSYSTNQVFMQ
jgi:clan AA aspartic protease (TIGR02281 family)